MSRRIVLLACAVVLVACDASAQTPRPTTQDTSRGGEIVRRIEDLFRRGTPAPVEPQPEIGVVMPDPAVPPPAPSHYRYVATDGNDANPGTREAPWRTPGHAVKQARPGMHILMRGGTYPPFTIDQQDGTEDAPIVLMAAPGSRPVIQGGQVLVRRAHWVLEGLEVRPGATAGVRFTGRGARHNVLRESVVRDGSGNAGVSIDLGATHITLEGNEIYNIWRGPHTDAHGVIVQPDAVGIRILGNEIHGNSGDSIQCIGPGQDAPNGAPARDILIEGNLMYGDRENAVDIKRCENVVIRGNVARNYRASSTSKGEAIVIHSGARNVVVEKNDISDASRGVVASADARGVVVRRNVFHRLTQEKTAILFGTGGNFEARHNTILGAEVGVKVLSDASGVSVLNNIFSGTARSVTGSARVDRNLFFQAPVVGSGSVGGNPLLDAEFVPHPDSPAIDRASPGDEEPVCGNGPDLGALERC